MRRFNRNAYGNPCAKDHPVTPAGFHTTTRLAGTTQTPVQDRCDDPQENDQGASLVTNDGETGTGNDLESASTNQHLSYSKIVHTSNVNQQHVKQLSGEEQDGVSWDDPSETMPPRNKSVWIHNDGLGFGDQQSLGTHANVLKHTSAHRTNAGPVNNSSCVSKSANSSISDEQTNGVTVTNSQLPSHAHPAQNMTRSKRHVMDCGPLSIQNDSHNAQLINRDVLQEARRKELRVIQLRIKAREKSNTTSLKDLGIARKSRSDANSPAQASTPAQSVRIRVPPDQTVSSPLANVSKPTSVKYQSSDNIPRQQTRQSKNLSFIHNETNSNQLDRASGKAPISTKNQPASRVELKPVEFDNDSNAYGSSISSNASQASKDSVRALHSGKWLHQRDVGHQHPLSGWDGGVQPPPADWDDRPRFDNDTPEFRDEFNRWTHDVCQMTTEIYKRHLTPITTDLLVSNSFRPDGISMVPRDTTVTKENAHLYGYGERDVEDIMKYSQPIDPNDFLDWGKVDMERPENIEIKHETTEDLVSNWMDNVQERRRAADIQIESQVQAAEALFDHKTGSNPNKPMISIYLRPACASDVPQMTVIYNWYVDNSPRTAEIHPIEEGEMEDRLQDVWCHKLPFLVAVQKKNNANNPSNFETDAEVIHDASYAFPHHNPARERAMDQEKILGWACAEPFTARDYVERISAELAIYVDFQHRQLGIGRCLMDKLIEACDRGYMTRGGYSFHCPLKYRHIYNSGGGCDLHKLFFILRKWKIPRSTVERHTVRDPAKTNPRKKQDDNEKDYDEWLKEWLESWDFEFEGMLKGAGAKNGRFIDIVHLGRETRWQPAEGRIPDPMPGL